MIVQENFEKFLQVADGIKSPEIVDHCPVLSDDTKKSLAAQKDNLTDRQLTDLVNFGTAIDTMVTPAIRDGRRCVHIRKLRFFDAARALMMLRHIQATEMPETYDYLVA